MNTLLGIALFSIVLVLNYEEASAKKGGGQACPKERDITCIDCTCDPASGFNTCVPAAGCPTPVKTPADIKYKDKKERCSYGPKFVAQCTLCECSGEGDDHCAMCFALPVRKAGQPDDINKQLPQATDNRFFNYIINGWDKAEEDEEE